MDSGAFLPEFAPFLRQMLASNTLKTPLWLAGLPLSAPVAAEPCQWRRRSASTDLCIPPYNDYQKVWRRCRQSCAPELAAISGLPAITLPCGVSRIDLPVGMEMLSVQEDEAALMVLALACEGALGEKG